MRIFSMLAALIVTLMTPHAVAADRASLADLAFLEGAWRGGEGFVFEETWSGASGGVMTAMARGFSGDDLHVLEYIVVSDEEAGVVMRFKHYNADFTTWEKAGPTTLTLTSASENDLTFSADPPSENVKSIRYWLSDENTLQADIVLVEDGEQGGFSLTFNRVE